MKVIAEYRHHYRSCVGVIGIILSAVMSAGFLAAAIGGHFFWYLPLAIAVYAFVVSIVAFVRNDEMGCSVDEENVTWWCTTWPYIHKSLAIKDIAKIHLETNYEFNSLRILKTDREVIEIQDSYIGTGKKIYAAIVSVRPEIEAKIDGIADW